MTVVYCPWKSCKFINDKYICAKEKIQLVEKETDYMELIDCLDFGLNEQMFSKEDDT